MDQADSSWKQWVILTSKRKQTAILVSDLNTPNIKKKTDIFQYWLVSRCYYGNTVQVFRCDHSMVMLL